MDRRVRARCPLPPGDQAGRRCLPGPDLLRPRLRLDPPRPGPVERRRHPQSRRARGARGRVLARRRRAARRSTDRVGDVRRRAGGQCVRAERAVTGARAVRVQARVARARCATTSAAACEPSAPDRRVRRLQHRARRPRRVRPGEVRRFDPRHAGRARRARRAARLGPRRRVPPAPRRGPAVLVVGLPRRRLPRAPRAAHRPRARVERFSPTAPSGRSSTATPARASRRRRTTPRSSWSSSSLGPDSRSGRRTRACSARGLGILPTRVAQARCERTFAKPSPRA